MNRKTKLTRRKLLKAVGAGAAWIALKNTPGCELAKSTPKTPHSNSPSRVHLKRGGDSHSQATWLEDVWNFRSRPDLQPPTLDIATRARATAPGYIFVAPKKGVGQHGPMIVDDRGQPVWFLPLQDQAEYAMDFKVQRYQGNPVLTWAEGRVVNGHGLDEYVILDGSYREITRVRAGNGYRGDHHEFLITPFDTALLTIYEVVPSELSPVGGPAGGSVWDAIAQEIDIPTGEVLLEWHSLGHVGLEEAYTKPSQDPGKPFCYFHINSIDVDFDGNLLVCSRNTFTVYKIDRNTGEVMWRLGGKKSDFEMGPGTRTAYQHDARRQADGTITIFDNGDADAQEPSRAIVLELDEDAMSTSLVRQYSHPDKRFADTQGNIQLLANGNVFIGWGSEPFFSEFSRDGELLFDARFPPEDESYRAYRFPWRGQPEDVPAVAAERVSKEETTVYASWNGATEVAFWEVMAGSGPDRMKPLGDVPRSGFETAIAVRTGEPYVGVEARDSSGRVLATSKAVRPAN